MAVLSNLETEQEKDEEAQREAKRRKNAEKRQQEIVAGSGANGQVAALDGVRYTGTFGVSFAPEKTMTKQELRVARKNGTLMEAEVEDTGHGKLAVMPAKRQAGFEVARRNYLIKKSKKIDKMKVCICCSVFRRACHSFRVRLC
jgi:hypothetical protein